MTVFPLASLKVGSGTTCVLIGGVVEGGRRGFASQHEIISVFVRMLRVTDFNGASKSNLAFGLLLKQKDVE